VNYNPSQHFEQIRRDMIRLVALGIIILVAAAAVVVSAWQVLRKGDNSDVG